MHNKIRFCGVIPGVVFRQFMVYWWARHQGLLSEIKGTVAKSAEKWVTSPFDKIVFLYFINILFKYVTMRLRPHIGEKNALYEEAWKSILIK